MISIARGFSTGARWSRACGFTHPSRARASLAVLAAATVAILFTFLTIGTERARTQSSAPGGVMGTALWVKANRGLQVNASNQVEQWFDQSGSGNTTTELRAAAPTHTSAIAPSADILHVPGAINFNPAVDFTGAVGKSLKGAAATEWDVTPVSIFAVAVSEGAPGGGYSAIFDGVRDWTSNDSISAGVGLGWNGNAYFLDGSGCWTAVTTAVTGPRVVRGIYSNGSNGNGGRTWIDGVQRGTGTSCATNATTLFEVGGRTGGTAPYDVRIFNGKIAEVIVYRSTLTVADSNKVESYLATKYGITLGTTTSPIDYTASDGTVYWTGSPTYQNNIAGIGRDDLATQDQRQSRSINTASLGNLVTIGNGMIAADNPSNPNALVTDRSFMVWGDSGGSIAPITPVASATTGLKRMARVWQVQETGTVGTVTVRVPVANLPGGSPMLIRSTDATFTSGMTFVPMMAVASNYEVSIDLTNGDFFTFASVMPSPGGVANGLEYWIRPDDMTVSGGIVTNWDDVYGLHTNEVFSGGGFTVASGFNFHPTAATNGDRWMSFLGQQLLSGAPAGEIFYMLESTGAHNTNDGYPSEFGGGGSATTWEYDYSDSNVYSGWGSTVRKVWNPLLAPAGGPSRDVLDPHVYNVLSAPGEWTARFDALTNFTTTTNAISFNSSPSTNTYIGASHVSVFKGRLSEVVVFRRGLTTVERQAVQSYLATKYGVTLGTIASPIDYLAADGTTVYWTGSPAYQNNVAGVGRDDASGLHQRQSQSVNTSNSGNLVTMGLGTIAVDNATNGNTFPADNSFFVWGDNAASTEFATPTATPVAGAALRMPRTWRVQETGTVGQVRVGAPSVLVSTTPLYLVVSNDALFDQTDQWIAMSPLTVGATSYRAADVDFTSGQIFTFATVLPLDYGDAPASYGTLLGGDGARHGVANYDATARTGTLMLGTQIGADADGQPSATANADGFDDGVAFPALVAGQQATLAVTATNNGPAARLSAWADWNNNGSFADSGEQFASDLVVTTGGNAVSVTPPASIDGPIVLRFRLSTQTGLGPTGLAADGEVEDYQVTVTRQSDLAITKTDGQAGYTPGGPISYTIVVTNPGPSNASTLDIVDAVPSIITGVSVACMSTGTATCGANGSSANNVSFTSASLAAGAGNSVTITVNGTVDPSAIGNLTNTAQVTVPGGAGYTDPNLGNNTATDTDTQGTPIVDLAITKTDGQTTYVPGAPVTYTLVVTNAGPSTAAGFSVSDVLPPGFSDVTASCALVGLGSCGANATAGTTATFTNLVLAPGAVNALTFSVTGTVSPNTTGTITNTATVTAGPGSNEANLANNSALDVDAPGAGRADLAITKTDGQAGSAPGTAASYTLTVTNLGPSHAPSFQINDIVPPMISAVTVACVPSGTASCGTNVSSGNTLAFSGASLNAGVGQSLTLTVSGLVDPNYGGGTIVNTAEVIVPGGAGYTDSELGNNTISDTNTALPQQVDLAIAKTDGQTSYTPGASITYTLVVTNAGPSTASSVSIADTVPASITGVTASCIATGIASCGSNVSAGNSVAFNNASVYPGADHQLTITISGVVSPDTTGALVNTATVTKGVDASEPNVANNSVTDTDAQGDNVADLAITKTDGAASYTAGTGITYQIVVVNNGPSHANGFTLDDTLVSALSGPIVTCAVTSGVGSCGTNASAGNAISFAGVVLNAGSAVTLTINATIDPSATGDLVNTAMLVVPGVSFTDPDLANNAATDTDTAGTQTIDLLVTKSNGQSTYVPGVPVSYTVTVTNAGPSTATGFSISDSVPPAITGVIVSCVATGGSNCGSNSSSGQDLLFSNATLVPGDTLTLTIAGTVAPGATGDLVNTVTVTPGFGVNEIDPASNSSTDTDTAASAQVDLAIAKTDGQTIAVPGMPIAYTVVVTNTGPSHASGFSIADAVPALITGVTANCAVTGSGSCGTNATTANNASFTGLSLAPGAGNQLTFTIGGTVNAGATGALANTASVSPALATFDSNPSNDSATDTDSLIAQADIRVSKVGPGAVAPGTTATYTITVRNNGPSVSAPVTLADPAPAGLTVVTVADACAVLPCALGALTPGDTRVVTVQMAIAPDYAGANPILNTATVTSSTDPSTANNSATASAIVTAATADLAVTKSGPASVTAGRSVVYTITIANAGPATATGVLLDDPTPPGLTLSSVSGACTTLPCPLAALAPADVRTLTVRYDLPVSYNSPVIVNTAAVSATTVDPSAANNTASATTQVSGPTCDVNGDGIPELVTGAGPGGGPHVRVWNISGAFATELTGFYAYSPYFTGGVTVACRDVTGDGIAEIITGAGPGGGPHVRVWQYTEVGRTVTELTGFWGYSPYFAGGVRVASADVTGDGVAEIITGAGPGGGPHVRVWSLNGGTLIELTGYWGDAPAVPTGMFVGAGDVDGDGVAEIVTGAGDGSEPSVRVWSVAGGVVTQRASFYAYHPLFGGGVSVAVGDLDGDGVAEVITGAGPGGGPHVRAWRVSGSTATELSGFFAYSPYYAGGTYVAAGDMDSDGVDELITGAGPGGGPHVRVWKLVGAVFVEVTGWFAYDPAFAGGAFVGR